MNYVDNSALKIHLRLEHGQSFDKENRNEIAAVAQDVNARKFMKKNYFIAKCVINISL